MKSSLDVPSGLLKGLSLGNLCRIVGADTNDVGAQEDEDVSTHLERAEDGHLHVKVSTFYEIFSNYAYF